jgi:hypothetical protein
MSWKEVEYIFNRALKFSFSKRKLLLTAAVLVFCGLVIVCFRTLGSRANDWFSISMTFLPIFFNAAILLAGGIILTRVYHHEVKGLAISYKKILNDSKDLIVEIAYLAVPMILVYLLLWTLLGIFYLLKEIPGIGDALGVILSFGPFLLLLGSLVLSLITVLVLFVVTPLVSFRSCAQLEMLQMAWKRLALNPFSNIASMFIALFPLSVVSILMTIAAIVTGKTYVVAENPMAIGMEWFFIVLPFSALLAPAAIFFFNFSAEVHVLLLKKMNTPSSG